MPVGHRYLEINNESDATLPTDHDIIEMETLSNLNIVRSRPKSRASSSSEDKPLASNLDQHERTILHRDETDVLYYHLI
jgi:hypothetical protein